MSQTFQLSCESTADLPYAYVDGRGISVLFYHYSVDGELCEDDMCRHAGALPDFYEKLAAGHMPSTSQINEAEYMEYFDALLQQGDVLHVALGTGMTTSVQNAYAAADILREKYPGRRLAVVDSLCSSSGYGMLVDVAADMRDNGDDIDTVESWLLANRNRVHHQFFSTDLTQYRRSGRVSGPAATVGTLLGICPIMRINSEGRIIAYSKVRGLKKAIETTSQAVMAHIKDGAAYRGKLYIAHSNSPDLASAMRDALVPLLGDIARNAPIYDIGTIIAAHCGPGTVAVFFFGDEREK